MAVLSACVSIYHVCAWLQGTMWAIEIEPAPVKTECSSPDGARVSSFLRGLILAYFLPCLFQTE